MTSIQIAINQIKTDEGLRLKPYTCTAGKMTIGYGRNLDDVGITSAEAEDMLRQDLTVAELDAKTFATQAVWGGLSPARRAVLINMAFNLGLTRLRQFKRFHLNMAAYAYAQAADEMLDSKWARQVGPRAQRLSDTMRHG